MPFSTLDPRSRRGFSRRDLLAAAAVAALSVSRLSADSLVGEIRLVGYNDMAEMIAALNAAFARFHPHVGVRAELTGTRTGPPALASGQASIAPMGARFTPAQLAAYRNVTGAVPAGFRIAHASLNPKALSGPNAIFVHRDNPLASADLPALKRIFTRAGPHFWGELGIAGPMARMPIRMAGLKPDTPLALEFRSAVFPALDFAPDVRGFGQSREVVDFVGSEPLALGFAALNRETDAVHPLGLCHSPAAPAIFASEASLRAGAYPLDRHLWLYARQDHRGRLERLPRAYIEFALSREGQAVIGSGSLGYLSLGSEERDREIARLH